MISGLSNGYILVAGFLPIIILSIFWFSFTKGIYRRLRGESNDEVRLENAAQYASLPTLIIILIQTVAVGIVWLMGDVNLIPIVALNFVYFYLTMMSVRFVLTHLDSIESALLTYKKSDREKYYLEDSVKLVYNKIYYINISVALLGVLLFIVLGFLVEINYTLEVFILLGYYVISVYFSAIRIPDYIKVEYIDKVKTQLVKEGKIKESVEVQQAKQEEKKRLEKEENKLNKEPEKQGNKVKGIKNKNGKKKGNKTNK